MRKVILALAGAAIITSTTAQAADDTGLRLHTYRGAGTQSAMGARLGLSLKLDSQRVVRDSERLQIGFAAGPVLAVQDARTGAVRHGQSQLASFTLRPGYSASFMLAGRPIVTGYTQLGAADKQAGESNDDGDKPRKKSGPSTATVLIGVGTLLAVGGAIIFFNELSKASE
jgi:hypothetical protein